MRLSLSLLGTELITLEPGRGGLMCNVPEGYEVWHRGQWVREIPPPTAEEIAAAEAERDRKKAEADALRAAEAEELARSRDRHPVLVSTTGPYPELHRIVAEHKPDRSTGDLATCCGCEAEIWFGNDGDGIGPAWPCDAWRAIDNTVRVFIESR